MASTSTISSLGVGSGLDAESIVTKLVALERQPITQLQSDASKLQTKISAYGQIKSNVSAVRDAAQKLTDPALWAATTATSADPSSVTFATSAGATPGNYSVSVTALATTQSIVGNTTYSSAASTVGSGTLTIQTGSWSGNAFSAKTGSSAIQVTIASGDSLATVRDKINAANAGVTASIVNDANGSRLVMNSSATGAANGFRIQATDDDGNNVDNAGLSALAYDPANSTAGTTQTQAAGNAAATINGVAVSSSTNTFTDVMAGISMTVGKVTTSPVNVTVGQDNDAITKAITDFATAYSTLATYLKNNTKYDESTKQGGTLQGDSLAVGTLNQFRATLGNSTTASSVFSTLSSVGLEMQTNGTLVVNNKKLTAALGNLGEVKKLFANVDTSGGGADGLATQIRTLSDQMLSIDGTLTTRTDGLNKTISNNQKRQDELDARATLYEKRLRAQYTALDTAMASISTQSNYVTQMINAYNKG